MPLPICGKCHKEMRVAQNEIVIREYRRSPHLEMIWYGDMLVCPTCGHTIYAQFGQGMNEATDRAETLAQEYGSVEFEH